MTEMKRKLEKENYNWRWEEEMREMKKNFFINRKRSKRGNIKWINEVWVNQLREGKWVRFEFEIQIGKSCKVKKMAKVEKVSHLYEIINMPFNIKVGITLGQG